MRALAQRQGLVLREDGALAFVAPGIDLWVDHQGVWVNRTDPLRLRWSSGRWLAGGEPWSKAEKLPEPLDRLLPDAARAEDPVERLCDLLASEWLAGHAAHLFDASELDLSSVHAPLPVPIIAVFHLCAALVPFLFYADGMGEMFGFYGTAFFGILSALVLLSPLTLGARKRTLVLSRDAVLCEREALLGTTSWRLENGRIARVRAHGSVLVFESADGGRRRVPLRGRSAATADAVARMIEQRIRRSQSGTDEDVPLALRRARAVKE